MNNNQKITFPKSGFADACGTGDLESIKIYIENKETLIAENFDYDFGFRYACEGSQLEVIKYLTKVIPDKYQKELFKKSNNWINLIGYDSDDKQIVEFLLTSKSVKYNSNAENYLVFLCNISKKDDKKKFVFEIINYLIFDYKIEKTENIKNLMISFPEVENLFSIRELTEKLETELTFKTEIKKKNKI